jgi:hypothetical protein
MLTARAIHNDLPGFSPDGARDSLEVSRMITVLGCMESLLPVGSEIKSEIIEIRDFENIFRKVR